MAGRVEPGSMPASASSSARLMSVPPSALRPCTHRLASPASLAGRRPRAYGRVPVLKAMMLKRSSGFKWLSTKSSAPWACENFSPSIEPDWSSTTITSFASTWAASTVTLGAASSRK